MIIQPWNASAVFNGVGKNCPKELLGNEYLRFQKKQISKSSSAHSVVKGWLENLPGRFGWDYTTQLYGE